jgi:hypothetical protein
MWQTILNFIILFHNISKYVKLVKIVIIQVVGLVEDGWVFNNLNFIKFRFYNWLTRCLMFVCLHFGQSFFTIQNFPYDEGMKIW